MGKKEQAPALAIFVQGSLWVWSATSRGRPPDGGLALAVFHMVPRVPAAPNLFVHPPADLRKVLLPPSSRPARLRRRRDNGGNVGTGQQPVGRTRAATAAQAGGSGDGGQRAKWVRLMMLLRLRERFSWAGFRVVLTRKGIDAMYKASKGLEIAPASPFSPSKLKVRTYTIRLSSFTEEFLCRQSSRRIRISGRQSPVASRQC